MGRPSLLGPAKFDSEKALGCLHRIFATPTVKMRACIRERPEGWEPAKSGPEDGWRKISRRWKNGQPQSLDQIYTALTVGRYIAYVPASAGIVGLDLDEDDFEGAQAAIARVYPHSIRVRSASGNGYHVLFAAPKDPTTELPHKFSMLGGGGIVRHEKGYLCFNTQAYLEGLADAVTMAADGTLPEVPVERLKPPAPRPRPKKPAAGSSASQHTRRQSLDEISGVLRRIDPSCEREVWIKVGMGVHDETQGSQGGLELLDRWSSGELTQSGQPDNYSGPADVEKAWDSFGKRDGEEKITFGTVVHLANESGAPVGSQASPGGSSAARTPSDSPEGADTPRSDPAPPGSQPAHTQAGTEFAFSSYYWTTHHDHLFDPRTGYWWAFKKGKGWYRHNAELSMREIIETHSHEARNPRSVQRLVTLGNSLKLAGHKLRLPDKHQWDPKPGIVGFEGGLAMDLATGTLRPAEKTEYLTRKMRVPPADSCEDWENVVLKWCRDDEELAGYVQVALGYSLFGDPREQAFFVIQGPSATGKSRIVATVAHAFGDYAHAIPVEIFATARNVTPHPTGLASLDGPRFLYCSEVDENAAWNTTRLKSLAGGDKIAARFMRRDFFQFRPRGVLCIALNDMPSLRTVSDAIRRRLRVIPFHHVIPPDKRDPKFDRKWRAAAKQAQVVRWAVDGARMYAESGLPECAAVAGVTKTYLTGEDVVGRFLDDCVEFTENPSDRVTRTAIRRAASVYAESEGRRLQIKGFYQRIAKEGAGEVKRKGVYHLLGVRLRHEPRADAGTERGNLALHN